MRETPFSVEDCKKKIPNQFEVALISARRARELLTSKSEPKVDITDPNLTIRSVALMEIAEGKIGVEYLKEKK